MERMKMKNRTPPENRMVDKENKTQPKSRGASSLLENKSAGPRKAHSPY